MSVVSAFLAKATTLVATANSGSAVPVYFGEAAMNSTTAVVLPFVVVEDDGAAPEYEMEYGGPEVTTLQVHVFATALAQIDSIVLALKYGGGIPSARGGLDFGALGSLGSYLSPMECKRVKEKRDRQHQEYTQVGQIAHKCQLTYEITANVVDA